MRPSSASSARPALLGAAGSSSPEQDRRNGAPHVLTRALPASANPSDVSARTNSASAPASLKVGSIPFGKPTSTSSAPPKQATSSISAPVHALSKSTINGRTQPRASTSRAEAPALASYPSSSKVSDAPSASRSPSQTSQSRQGSEHKSDWPKLSPSWKVTYDPELDTGPVLKGGDRQRRIGAAGVPVPIKDPRKTGKHEGTSALTAPQLQRVQWTWTAESTDPPPKPPPAALVVTNLLPTVSLQELSDHFRQFGAVEELEIHKHPFTFSSLGIVYVAYRDCTYFDTKSGTFVTRPGDQNGSQVAQRAAEKTHGQKLGRVALEANTRIGVARCRLDVSGSKGHSEKRQVLQELERKEKQRKQAKDDQEKAEKQQSKDQVPPPQKPKMQGEGSRQSTPAPGTTSASVPRKRKSPSPSSAPTRRQLRQEALARICDRLEDKMEERMASQYIRRDLEPFINKRYEKDKSSSKSKDPQLRPPASTAPQRVGSSKFKNVVPRPPPPIAFALPPKSPPKPAIRPSMPAPQVSRPLPGSVASKAQQQNALTSSLPKLPSFNNRPQLPRIGRNKPATSSKPTSALARSTLADEDERGRSMQKLPGPSAQRGISPTSSLSSLESCSTSHDTVAEDTDDSDAIQPEQFDQEEESSESDAEDDDQEADQNFKHSGLRGASPPGRRSPRLIGHLSPKRSPKRDHDIDWTDDSSDEDMDDQTSKAALASLPSSKRPHVITNGHGVKQIGARPQNAQLSPKKDLPPLPEPQPVVEPEKPFEPRAEVYELEEEKSAMEVDEPIETKELLEVAPKPQLPQDESTMRDAESVPEPSTAQEEKQQSKQSKKRKQPPSKGRKTAAKRKKATPKATETEAVTPATPEPHSALNGLAPETPAFPPFSAGGDKPGLAAPFELQPDTPAGLDLYRDGLVADEEDFYFIRKVLQRIKNGQPMHPDPAMLEPQVNEEELDLPIHGTGSARTEGYYKRAAGEKAAYLPQRNKAMVEVSETNANSTAISRSSRAESRRAAGGSTNSTSDSDIIKFNQFKSRGKLLKFARSPIHDWGLYALERIDRGDLVIEYIGELIRQQIADKREIAYERSGIGSSYLFRIDDDFVVDATKKGSMSRLINHSCNPNCIAKIITINGAKKIVIYARQTIEPGDEITYDYKFAVEAAEFKIPCLCGAPNCRRYLN